MRNIRRLNFISSILPIITFLLIHIAFDWIAYDHSPFKPNYFKINLSGYLEIYIFVTLICIAGISIKAKYFYSLFFVFAVYGEVQMLYGYWKLGAHPTMAPAMMQFMLYAIGFVLGSIVEVSARVINANSQKQKLS